MKKTILYYNWNSLNSTNGGGVNVYQKNVINSLKNNKDFNIVVLSSGVMYDNSKKIYIKEISNNFNVKEYAIINSPVLAPVKQNQENFKNYIEDSELATVFIDFCKSLNNLSVIHFNNLEGLSINCLNVKDKIKKVKVIYSAHNYFSVCPEVNLWYKQNSNCLNNNECDCKNCFKYPKRKMEIKKRRTLPKIKNKVFRNIFSKMIHLFYIFEKDKEYEINYLEKFKKMNIEYLNKYCDCIIAVSERVKEILINKGIKSKLVKTVYIGNDFSYKNPKKCVANINSKVFKVIYLGPMRKDKGFYFLIDAFDKIPKDISKSTEITLASKFTDKEIFKKINNLKSSFKDIKMLDGYNRNELENILSDKNLGVVPILWEDNLPQVAIEMIACGVPVLCGNYGGAKEVANNSNFVFNSGNVDDFVKKIIGIYNDRTLLEKYYNNKLNLITMDSHIEELIKIYNGDF